MARYIETGTNYAYTVERIKELNFRSLRSVSVEFAKRLPAELNSELYEGIQHGVCKLQSEPELNMYIHALGLMHEAKLQYAFEQLPDEFTSIPVIDIIDYGCGQAIGTICYADFLRRKGKTQIVRRITLIEPSELALKRAALHVSCFFPQAEIVTHLKGFDDLEEDDLCMNEETPTLHIFSNVIDLADDYFNLERFVSLINKCSIGENHYLCIEPHFDYEEKDKPLERFIELLDAETYYCKTFPKGTFVEGRDWTCRAALCESKSQGIENVKYSTAVSNALFRANCRDLMGNRAKRINNCIIREVTCSTVENGKIFVNILVEEPPTGKTLLGNNGFMYCLEPDKESFRVRLEDIVKSLQDDDDWCWLGGIINGNLQILSKVLEGGTIDIIQEMFLLNEINDIYAAHIQGINFRISNKGRIVAKKMADIALGFVDEETIPLLLELAKNAENDNQFREAFKFYKQAADAESVEAQNKLGYFYYYGKGVERNVSESVKWYRKAAEQGNAIAQHNIGVFYENGTGVIKDETEAVKWYYKAAKQGYASAQCSLGICYDLGRGINADKAEAVRWYRKAADQGNMIAQTNLGVCYKLGQGISKDEAEAVKWYRKAAEQEYATAQYFLGLCYEEGEGTIQNEDEAIKWYMAAEKQGHKKAKKRLEDYSTSHFSSYRSDWLVKVAKQGYAKAQCDLANSIEFDCNQRFFSRLNIGAFTFPKKFEKEYQTIFELYYKSAEQNYAEGQCGLARCYLQGQGVKQNFSEAVKWYHKAAEQDNNTAKLALFELYALGKGVEKSITEAVVWLNRYKWEDSKISSKGEELYSIGRKFYYGGLEVKQSYGEAVIWWKMAADENNHRAEYMLGVCYEKGQGIEQSYEKAFSLFLNAAEQGFADAKNAVGMCYEKGQGIEQSYEEATKWYSEAAVQKNKEAMCNLGNCYRYGRGVKRSYSKAIKWYKESDTYEAQMALDEVYHKNFLRRWLKIIQFKFGSLE